MDIFNSLFQFTQFLGNIPLGFVNTAATAVSQTASCLLANGFASGCAALPNNFFSDLGSVFTNVSSFFSTGWANIINYFWYFIPDGGTLPTAVHTAAQNLGGTLADVAFILPVGDMVAIMALSFAVMSALVTFKITKIVVSIIRGGYNPMR